MNPERTNYERIEQLEARLADLRETSPTRDAEAIREIGYEIAIAIREVGAMLINVGWEQTYSDSRGQEAASRPEQP